MLRPLPTWTLSLRRCIPSARTTPLRACSIVHPSCNLCLCGPQCDLRKAVTRVNWTQICYRDPGVEFYPWNIGDGLPARSEPWSIPDPAPVIFQQRCHKIKLSGLRMPCWKTTSFSYIFLNLRYTTRVLYALFLRGEVFRVEKEYPGYAYRSMQSMQGGKWRWGASWGSKVDGLLSPCELLLVQSETLRSVLTRLESSRKSFRLLLSVRNAWTLRSFSRNHPKSFRLPIRKTADSEN